MVSIIVAMVLGLTSFHYQGKDTNFTNLGALESKGIVYHVTPGDVLEGQKVLAIDRDAITLQNVKTGVLTALPVSK